MPIISVAHFRSGQQARSEYAPTLKIDAILRRTVPGNAKLWLRPSLEPGPEPGTVRASFGLHALGANLRGPRRGQAEYVDHLQSLEKL